MKREVDHYSLQAFIAGGFKIENERAIQFRKWANQIVKDYTIQGWTMDVERLKHGGSVLDNEFFERQLEKVREIRLSERNFYQKIIGLISHVHGLRERIGTFISIIPGSGGKSTLSGPGVSYQ